MRIIRAPPLRLAIVGAGPSGFYAASRLLNAFPKDRKDDVQIDIFDRLPTPHGLVRYGVAPDHPDVKNVQHKFDHVSLDPRLRFYGNVNLVQNEGKRNPYPHAFQLPLKTLSRHYSHILFSYGSSQGRPLGIPGSGSGELAGVHSALEFVNWYNGHPAAHDPNIIATQRGCKDNLGINLGGGKQHLTVVGAGNVALDVARIVLRSSTPFLEATGRRPTSFNKTPGLASLAETDIPEPVLAHLASSKISRVDIFARRGPAQLAFTNKELREIMSLEGVGFSHLDKELLSTALSDITKTEARAKAEASTILGDVRVRKRMISLLEKGSKTKLADKTKSWGLNFFKSPAEFSPKEDGGKQVGKARWNLTSLAGQSRPAVAQMAWANEPPGLASTGQTVMTETDMIVSSVGYRSEPLWDAESSSDVNTSGPIKILPFDTFKAIVPNKWGRVTDPTGQIIPGIYVSGWLARGPVGVIASTMMDAYSVADLILQDYQSSITHNATITTSIDPILSSSTTRIVSKEDWRTLDMEEQKRGATLGKIREKILTVDEMLRVIG